MDTKPSPFWNQNATKGVLVFLISVLSITLTGCDTVSSADSHPLQMPTAPKVATAADTENPAPSGDSAPEHVAKAPARLPKSTPSADPGSAPTQHRPSPAQVPTPSAKGGERLVAMASASAQPPANDPAAPIPAPASRPSDATSAKPVIVGSSIAGNVS